MAIDNASERSQIPVGQPDPQSFIQILGLLGQDSYSQRAEIFSNRPLCR
jgi:hypothetical protein